MWPAVVGILTLALLAMGGVFSVLRRRERANLNHVHGLLRARGDDGILPESVPDSLQRLGRRLQDTNVNEEQLGWLQATAALNEVPVAVVVADASGAVVFRNKVAAPFENPRHGDALVRSIIDARLADAINGEATDEEVRLHGPPERVLFVVGTPLEGPDRDRIGALVLVDDLSEQHRVDAVRRDFVANVSHELRTPVGALSLLAETLQGETDPEVAARFVDRIQAEATRLGDLINDLLDLSRIEGRVGSDNQPVPMAQIVGQAVAAVRQAADHKSIVLVAEGVDRRDAVLGDTGHLASAVTNLLDNAVKYTPDGGEVRCRLSSDGEEVFVTVTDSGIGIPRRDLSRIFERFFRVDRGRSAQSGGTGLGLSIVRHVAVEHGGRVEVTSQEGVGSTFTLVLPLHQAEQQPGVPADPTNATS